AADFFADVEHRRFIALAFTDDHASAHGHRVHDLAHRFDGYLIGILSIALAAASVTRKKSKDSSRSVLSSAMLFSCAQKLRCDLVRAKDYCDRKRGHSSKK